MMIGVPSSCNAPAPGFDNLVSNCVADEFADGVNFQLSHNVGAVRLSRLHADSEK